MHRRTLVALGRAAAWRLALARRRAAPAATLVCRAARPPADTAVRFVSALVPVLLEMLVKLWCRLGAQLAALVVR